MELHSELTAPTTTARFLWLYSPLLRISPDSVFRSVLFSFPLCRMIIGEGISNTGHRNRIWGDSACSQFKELPVCELSEKSV